MKWLEMEKKLFDEGLGVRNVSRKDTKCIFGVQWLTDDRILCLMAMTSFFSTLLFLWSRVAFMYVCVCLSKMKKYFEDATTIKKLLNDLKVY